MIKRTKLLILAFSMWLTLMLAFMPVSIKAAPPAAPKTIKIGVLYDITGPGAAMGKMVSWGFQKAIEIVNKDGGVYVKQFDQKIPIELISADLASNPEKAVLGAEYLNGQNVFLLIGSTIFIPAAAGVIEKYHLPSMPILSAIYEPYKQGYRYLFSPGLKSPDIARMTVGVLDSVPKDRRPTLIALFEEQQDYGIELCKYMEQEATSHGYKTIRLKYQRFTKDLSPQILEAKAAGAEVVFSSAPVADGMLTIKQMKQLDYNPKAALLHQGPQARAAWKTLGKDGNYVISSGDGHWSFKYPGLQGLTAMAQAEFGEPPTLIHVHAYSAIQVAADAIKRAGALDREKIREALTATDVMTIEGPVKFRKDGTRAFPSVPCMQWQNGVETIVWPEDIREKPFVYPMPRWDKR